MKNTILLYENDTYLKNCQSKILSLEEDAIILDQTIFYPEGGGQPSDTGKIVQGEKIFDISHVYEKDGLVYHKTASKLDNLNLEEEVECFLDWDRRFILMQRHCGEHILSAAFYELFGGINRGFHMGEDYMTIDISLEGSDEYKEMTDQMIEAVEWRSNQYIWDNLPVFARRYETREEAEKQAMRKALALDEDIVLVCIGDENNAAGCVACCGTHPRTTGEVGLIKIYRWENYKGMHRITFDAGPIALKNVQANGNLVKQLSIRYSSEAGKLLDNIVKREAKANEVRQELYEIKQAYFESIAKGLNEKLKEADKTSIIYKHHVLKVEDFLSLAKILVLPKDKLLALVSIKENSLLLLSEGSIDVNKIIKENAPVWRGKGGGRSNSARAMFPDEEDLSCFLDFLSKAY